MSKVPDFLSYSQLFKQLVDLVIPFKDFNEYNDIKKNKIINIIEMLMESIDNNKSNANLTYQKKVYGKKYDLVSVLILLNLEEYVDQILSIDKIDITHALRFSLKKNLIKFAHKLIDSGKSIKNIDLHFYVINDSYLLRKIIEHPDVDIYETAESFVYQWAIRYYVNSPLCYKYVCIYDYSEIIFESSKFSIEGLNEIFNKRCGYSGSYGYNEDIDYWEPHDDIDEHPLIDLYTEIINEYNEYMENNN